MPEDSPYRVASNECKFCGRVHYHVPQDLCEPAKREYETAGRLGDEVFGEGWEPARSETENCPYCGEPSNGVVEGERIATCPNGHQWYVTRSQAPEVVPYDWRDDHLEEQFRAPSGLRWEDPKNSKLADLDYRPGDLIDYGSGWRLVKRNEADSGWEAKLYGAQGEIPDEILERVRPRILERSELKQCPNCEKEFEAADFRNDYICPNCRFGKISGTSPYTPDPEPDKEPLFEPGAEVELDTGKASVDPIRFNGKEWVYRVQDESPRAFEGVYGLVESELAQRAGYKECPDCGRYRAPDEFGQDYLCSHCRFGSLSGAPKESAWRFPSLAIQSAQNGLGRVSAGSEFQVGDRVRVKEGLGESFFGEGGDGAGLTGEIIAVPQSRNGYNDVRLDNPPAGHEQASSVLLHDFELEPENFCPNCGNPMDWDQDYVCSRCRFGSIRKAKFQKGDWVKVSPDAKNAGGNNEHNSANKDQLQFQIPSNSPQIEYIEGGLGGHSGGHPIIYSPHSNRIYLGDDGAYHWDLIDNAEELNDSFWRQDRYGRPPDLNLGGYVHGRGYPGQYIDWYNGKPEDHIKLNKALDLENPEGYGSDFEPETWANNPMDIEPYGKMGKASAIHEIGPEDIPGRSLSDPMRSHETPDYESDWFNRRPVIYDSDSENVYVGPNDYTHAALINGIRELGAPSGWNNSRGWIGHNPEYTTQAYGTENYGWYGYSPPPPPHVDQEIRQHFNIPEEEPEGYDKGFEF